MNGNAASIEIANPMLSAESTPAVLIPMTLPVRSEMRDGCVRSSETCCRTRSKTPAATPVTVQVRQVAAVAEIEVSDRGPGLPPDEAAHVFEPFYRADPSRGRADEGSQQGRGTGLGLAIVAAIAEAHGGSVHLRTERGEGAAFSVRISMGADLEPPMPEDSPGPTDS